MLASSLLLAEATALAQKSAPVQTTLNRSKLDLAQAKRYAVENNQRVKALRHAVEEASARRERSRSAFRPRAGIGAGAEVEAAPPEAEAIGIGYVYGTYNLFNGYRDVYRDKIAELEIEKAATELHAVEHELGIEVEAAFHEYLFRKTMIEAKDRALARNEAHQDLVKRSRMLGSISETDVMEFQLEGATLRSELVALKQELEDARSDLKRLLGDEVGAAIRPVGEMQHQHVLGKLMDYLARLKTTARPVKIAARDVEIASLERRVAEGRSLPQVDVEARYGYQASDQGGGGNKPTATVLLQARLELFTGRDASWEEREREAGSFRAEAELKYEINEAIRDVEVRFRNLSTIQIRSELERDVLENARRYYSSVLSEYKRGFKNSADLKAASELWSEAEVRRVALDYDFIKLRLELERTLGAPLAIEAMPGSHSHKAPKDGGVSP